MRGRELAWVLVLAIVFGGGLVLLASPKHVPVARKTAIGCGDVRDLVIRIPDPCDERRAENTPPADKGVPSGTVPPRSDPNHLPIQNDYPPESKRRGEQGTVIVLLTVEADGHVSASEVSSTSGFDRLDQAAKDWSLTWHLRPGTVNGVPTTMQYKFAVTYKITD